MPLGCVGVQDECYLAYCYPYTFRGDLQPYLAALEEDPRHKVLCRIETLSRTLGRNAVPLLTITEPRESAGASLADRAVVVLSARVHPGETNSSWAMRGATTAACPTSL